MSTHEDRPDALAGAIKQALPSTWLSARRERPTPVPELVDLGHITIGFYMTFWAMVKMMVKFAFASTVAGIIILVIWSILLPSFAAVVFGILQGLAHSQVGAQ